MALTFHEPRGGRDYLQTYIDAGKDYFFPYVPRVRILPPALPKYVLKLQDIKAGDLAGAFNHTERWRFAVADPYHSVIGSVDLQARGWLYYSFNFAGVRHNPKQDAAIQDAIRFAGERITGGDTRKVCLLTVPAVNTQALWIGGKREDLFIDVSLGRPFSGIQRSAGFYDYLRAQAAAVSQFQIL